MGDQSIQLEGRSAQDRAWYDCDVMARGGCLFLRFSGYGTDEEEPLSELSALRFSSLAAEAGDCSRLLPGTRITGFKRSPHDDLWVDAEVLGSKAGRHDGGKCHCSFTVRWLDTADAGKQAELKIGDICLLDSRGLDQHPQYRQYMAAMEGGTRRAVAGKGPRQPPARRPPPASPAEAISDADSEGEEAAAAAQGAARPARGAQQQEQEQAQRQAPRKLVLRPPPCASGPPCALCKLPTLLAEDSADVEDEVRRELGGLYGGRYVVHRRCAAFSADSGLGWAGKHLVDKSAVPTAVALSFQGSVGAALLKKCAHCGEVGATACCSVSSCRKTFHLHCVQGCKVDPDSWELRCPAHSVLGHLTSIGGPAFYNNRAPRARQAELDNLRSGKVARTQRLQGLSNGLKRRGRPGDGDEPRRSSRHGNKRVRYSEAQIMDGFSEGWQKGLRRAQGLEPGSDEEDFEDEDGEGSGILEYQDESDDDSGAFIDDGRRRNPGRRGKHAREPTPTRRTGRERTKVKSYAEEQEEYELKMEAYREAERQQKSGYEETRCQVCDSKHRGKEMLLCDQCDRGFHMFCLEPPLAAAPLAFWYCPDCLPSQTCEACGQSAPGGKRGGKKASAARELCYCSTCGALCHARCMKETEDGEPQCALCCQGLQHVEAILGCRTPAGRDGAREYFVKFKDKSYRRCCWVTDVAALRMAPAQLQRFARDTRDAANVEINVQEQWKQVERVVATRFDVEGGCEEFLVKWRGLEYDKATWEPREELARDVEALSKFERRMALRVERDAEAEQRARKAEAAAAMEEQPGWLVDVGLLKDYQIEGVGWALGKLRGGMSVILGDEMGLGKTIQAAVFLQLARERGLTTGPVAVVVPLSTFGSWEREMAKWAPGLEVLSYSGHQEARALIRKYELGSEEDDMEAVRRRQTSLIPRFHVMLTTYDVVIRDAPMLKRFDWSALIIDEGHSLKGQDSQRGRMLRELGAPWRMLLTGTPLQNNLRELLALLAFMADTTIDHIECRIKSMPDPSPPQPGAQAGGEEDAELLQAQAYIRKLHAYLEPRMLRRMKAVCLKGQMPPKITRKVACRMTPLQLQLYADVLAKDWDRVNAMVRNRLEKKSMNNILMRLRQACNHPYLLPGQEPEEFKDPDSAELAEQGWRLMVAASGKLTLLQQVLPRLLADGHRVLIFSQYVEMLDILEDFLHDFQDASGLLPKAEQDAAPAGGSGGGASGSEEAAVAASGGEDGGGASEPPASEAHGGEEEEDFVRGRPGSAIRYFRLDGRTKEWQRQAMMDSFNSIDCKVKVFLISTRAGSLGINLQTANTVVLYDPDFNPFVDAQAEGRAHRLGQEETVLVYQLYTASSVEERILALAAKKRKLEELVTKHLGRERDVSDEDIKSSVLYGWGNLMRAAEEDGKGGKGAELALSEAELAQLLDRQHVFADDLASGADAATLLGEVRAGGAAALKFEREASGEVGEEGGGAGVAGANPEMEAAMVRLIQQRARKYEQDKAAKEELGRGRRARGGANYCEQEDGGMGGLLGEESPDKPAKGGARRAADSEDDEYNPQLSAGLAGKAGKGSGENAEPNAHLLYSDDSDLSSSEDEGGFGGGAPGGGAAPAGGGRPACAAETQAAAVRLTAHPALKQPTPAPKPQQAPSVPKPVQKQPVPAGQPKQPAQPRPVLPAGQAKAPTQPPVQPKPAAAPVQAPQQRLLVASAAAAAAAAQPNKLPQRMEKLQQAEKQAHAEKRHKEKKERREKKKKRSASPSAPLSGLDVAQVAAALQLAQKP